MKSWYYEESGQQRGPIPEVEFKKLFHLGSLSPNTLVWTEGLTDWQEARAIENLLPTTSLPPPPPPVRKVVRVVAGSRDTGACPLCGSAEHMAKAKSLYGHMVCKKCYYGFANQRQLAYFVDLLAYYALTFIGGILVGLVMGGAGSPAKEIESVAGLLGWILLPVLLCKDCHSGQSVGKAMCGVRVIDGTTGQPGTIGASFKRNLPLVIPFMPLVVAGQLCKGHRTGDGWANTKVIWKKYASHPVFAPTQRGT